MQRIDLGLQHLFKLNITMGTITITAFLNYMICIIILKLMHYS